MANALQQAGALSEPSNFAPLHTNRIFTGLWTNRSPLRDAATSDYAEHYGMGRQDSIWTGYNSEISSRLTLRRRPGSSVYNATSIPPVKRFYSFNTFTLTDEVIRVMADTALTVYDATAPNLTPIFTKSAGAKSTYFLGVGNTLYFTNGVDNMQVIYNPTTGTWGTVYKWGIAALTTAPTVTQQPRPNPYPAWAQNTGHAAWIPMSDGVHFFNYLVLVDPNNNIQAWGYQLNNSGTLLQVKTGTLGTSAALPWATALNGTTIDGSVTWTNLGSKLRAPGFGYAAGQMISVPISNPAGTPDQLFVSISGGNAGSGTITNWPTGLGQQISDGSNGLIWQNAGPALAWTSIGSTTVANNVTTQPHIVDPNGYLQTVNQMGRTAASPPATWVQEIGALTTDAGVVWQNSGPYAVPGTAPVQYGYAYVNAVGDVSGMSPASTPITVIQGNQVTVSGARSTDPQVTTVFIYRTPQGGSTFLYLDQVPNPASGPWTYLDNLPDSALNTEIQAQVGGEGTPLPAGATCLGYHVGRIFAAVGNVVWISSGPDATVAGSSGNAGFDTQLVAQSKIICFWACSLGMVVFTVRDAYIILGSGTDADPLYMVVFIENLPLRSYDCFTINKTIPFLLLGNNQLVSLDPSAGIIEVGFPIADKLIAEYDSASSYVTFHSQSSLDTALYVANGALAPNPNPTLPPTPAPGQWYRMSANNAPEQGSAWSTKATLAAFNMGCVQSVEVFPGIYRLLTTGTTAGPILQRDATKNTDNGNAFAVDTVFGNIVLAQPGQLAALSFVTLESVRIGTRAGLALLLGEISGTFDVLNRTRQDPPILPPSSTLYSDRYHFAQNQNEAWCRHFQMQISWPAEDAPNEL